MESMSFAALGVVLLLVLIWWWARGRRQAERASRPRALAGAELVYMEALFRIQAPIRLVAKLDRGYRLPGGSLVLVELKTRRKNRVYLSDVIQLSAQRLAIEAQTGEVVEPYAYVSISRRDERGTFRSHRVSLFDAEMLIRLHIRRAQILAGTEAPSYAQSERACMSCALRSVCDRWEKGGVLRRQ